jgi:hypothetical protein
MLFLSKFFKYLPSPLLSVHILFKYPLLFDSPFFGEICTHVLLILSQSDPDYVSDFFLLSHVVKVGELF